MLSTFTFQKISLFLSPHNIEERNFFPLGILIQLPSKWWRSSSMDNPLSPKRLKHLNQPNNSQRIDNPRCSRGDRHMLINLKCEGRISNSILGPCSSLDRSKCNSFTYPFFEVFAADLDHFSCSLFSTCEWERRTDQNSILEMLVWWVHCCCLELDQKLSFFWFWDRDILQHQRLSNFNHQSCFVSFWHFLLDMPKLWIYIIPSEIDLQI